MFLLFSFHLCFDLPQVSNCYDSDSFIFLIFCPFFGLSLFFFFSFLFDLPQVSNCHADWGLITGARKAYDSGRGADYRGGKGL